MEGPLCLAECEEYKGQFDIHPSGAYTDCECIDCVEKRQQFKINIAHQDEKDYYEQGTQSVKIDEFTEELLKDKI